MILSIAIVLDCVISDLHDDSQLFPKSLTASINWVPTLGAVFLLNYTIKRLATSPSHFIKL